MEIFSFNDADSQADNSSAKILKKDLDKIDGKGNVIKISNNFNREDDQDGQQNMQNMSLDKTNSEKFFKKADSFKFNFPKSNSGGLVWKKNPEVMSHQNYKPNTNDLYQKNFRKQESKIFKDNQDNKYSKNNLVYKYNRDDDNKVNQENIGKLFGLFENFENRLTKIEDKIDRILSKVERHIFDVKRKWANDQQMKASPYLSQQSIGGLNPKYEDDDDVHTGLFNIKIESKDEDLASKVKMEYDQQKDNKWGLFYKEKKTPDFKNRQKPKAQKFIKRTGDYKKRLKKISNFKK